MTESKMEKKLAMSGFTQRDLEKIKINAYNNSTTIEGVVETLYKRFKTSLVITSILVVVWFFVLFTQEKTSVISFSITLIISIMILFLTMPTTIAFKAYIFRMKNKIN